MQCKIEQYGSTWVFHIISCPQDDWGAVLWRGSSHGGDPREEPDLVWEERVLGGGKQGTKNNGSLKKKKNNHEHKTGSNKKGGLPAENPTSTPSTIVFVEQAPDGRHRGLESTLGFNMKIVEKMGASLRSKFPLYNLWEGALCGREKCIPCSQGAEFVQPCTVNSVVYENICNTCNPGAGGKRKLELIESKVPTAYIGETSRSLHLGELVP